jgi:hypothetical protein
VEHVDVLVYVASPTYRLRNRVEREGVSVLFLAHLRTIAVRTAADVAARVAEANQGLSHLVQRVERLRERGGARGE